MICPPSETRKPENPENPGNPGNRLRRGLNRQGATGLEAAPILGFLGFMAFLGFPTYLGLLVYRGATLKWETDLALGVTP